MRDYQKYINALRKCAKEHDNDKTSMGHIIVSDLCRDTANLLEELEQEPKTGHCEDCKHFRKLPYHADTLGKCVNHWGFCPKGDWYCADFEPQERNEE